jgi:hypothetical protein
MSLGAGFVVERLATTQLRARRLLNVPRSRAQTLCGRRLDWVEA